MTTAQTALIAEAVKAVLAAQGLKAPAKKAKGRKAKAKKGGRKPLTDAEKAVFMAKNDAEAVAAFAAKGIQDVKPRENVLTYRKWFEKGRIVKKGEKAVRVGPFNLFHVSQTEQAPEVVGA